MVRRSRFFHQDPAGDLFDSSFKSRLQNYVPSLPNRKFTFDCVHPCPCGFYGDSQKPCTCAHALVTKYQKRISGPLLDRIDIHIEIPRVDYEKLSRDRGGSHPSVSVPACKLREIFKHNDIRVFETRTPNYRISCAMPICVWGEIRQFCKLPEEGQSLMRAAMRQLNLWARAYHCILKLARTIADLVGCEEIHSVHLAEALQYRPKLMA